MDGSLERRIWNEIIKEIQGKEIIIKRVIKFKGKEGSMTDKLKMFKLVTKIFLTVILKCWFMD